MTSQPLTRGSVVLCALAVWAIQAPVRAGDHPPEGKGASSAARSAPEFAYPDINPRSPTHGKSLALRELYAERGLVLNFIASWCGPCWLELPAFQKLGREGKPPVVCIAADEYGPADDLLRRAEHAGLDLPILLVPQKDVEAMGRKYTHDYLPSTYLIDKHGAIRGVMEGAVSEARLFGAVREHLGAPPPVKPPAAH